MTLPELKTRRLVLRPVHMSDAAAIAELAGKDFEIARWLTGSTWPYEDGSAEAFLTTVVGADPLETEAVFAVTLGGVFIGVAAIEAPGDLAELPDCPTLGYWLGRPFHGFGYGAEAARAVLAWGFVAHDCPAIAARVFEHNGRSRALLRTLGFVPVGKTIRFSRALDQKVSNIIVRLDRSAFEDRSAAA